MQRNRRFHPTQSAHPKKQTRSHSNRRKFIKKLASEAKAYGLSEADYYKLVCNVSSAIRTSFPDVQKIPLQRVAEWLASPMFPILLQLLSTSVMKELHNTLETSKKDTETTNNNTPAQLPQSNNQAPLPQRMQPQSIQPSNPAWPQIAGQPTLSRPQQQNGPLPQPSRPMQRQDRPLPFLSDLPPETW